MKIEPTNTENDMDMTGSSSQSPKEPRNLPIWLIIVIIVVLLGVFVFLFMKPNNNNNNASSDSTVETSNSKSISSETYGPPAPSTDESSTVEETSKSSSETEESMVDMKPTIKDFFMAYNDYNTKDKTEKQRAEDMLKYSDEDVVKDLLPNVLNDNVKGDGASPSLIAEYKVSDIKVTDDEGVKGNYYAVVTYTVAVNNNSSKHIDSYVVETKGDKIINVQQKSAVTE